ncbi:hypothetical protein MBLNU459_g5822t1 [Dothideomycetes sp. NU459]
MVARVPNDIFQFSTVSALMAGLAQTGPQVSQLPGYGTHGIGTFANMDGELIFLDGRAFQFTSDGSCKPAPPSTPLPFVQVTTFEPEYRVEFPSRLRKAHLLPVFGAGGPDGGGRNSFIAFSVTGAFRSVDVRVAGPQTSPEQPLREVAADAKQWTLTGVRGTMFGFMSPDWAQGISVAGPHMHFLSEEGEGGELKGGHVRDFEAEEGVQLRWAVTGRFHLGMPRGEKWEALELGVDADGIKKAED